MHLSLIIKLFAAHKAEEIEIETKKQKYFRLYHIKLCVPMVLYC